jgi:hypothetical protein
MTTGYAPAHHHYTTRETVGSIAFMVLLAAVVLLGAFDARDINTAKLISFSVGMIAFVVVIPLAKSMEKIFMPLAALLVVCYFVGFGIIELISMIF